VTVLIPFLLAAVSQPQLVESPVIQGCALDRGTICILDAGMVLTETIGGDETRITLHPERSAGQVATVTLSRSCRSRLAADPWLMGYSPSVPDRDRILMKLVFRVGKDCFLTLTAPSYMDREQSLIGYSVALGLVRLCEERPCAGRSLLDIVPQRLRRRPPS
jgi:hypothetical protein